MIIQAIRGMKDIVTSEINKWLLIESTARKIFTIFNFQEIRIPIIEKTELFTRSIGKTTNIVEKEMYTFFDRNDESLTIRPEATAGILRAYIEHKLYNIPGPHKFFTIGPMFRYERPQKGRLRQFHQLDIEVLDDKGPQIDAEIIIMLTHLLNHLEINKLTLIINSLGCQKCRPIFHHTLTTFLTKKHNTLCKDCLQRLHINPLRILDCKNKNCKNIINNAPITLDHLCKNCQDHFQILQHLLILAGINYEINPCLVRGLDYYIRTTFEVISNKLGTQNAIAGGGRYDKLIKQLGGPTQNGIGFGIGIERLALLIKDKPKNLSKPKIFFITNGEKPRKVAFLIVQALRTNNTIKKDIPWIGISNKNKSIKSQMRKANKLGVNLAVFLGEQELTQNTVSVKRMTDGQQINIKLGPLVNLIIKSKGVKNTLYKNNQLDNFLLSLLRFINF